jgi:exodeoxyribonuclease VII large subunit
MQTEQKHFLFDVPSVSELTSKVKDLLESNFMDILVEGEASNVKQSRNGHVYFTLKDENASLPCVMWRGMAERIGLAIEDGKQYVAGGDIQVYPPHGKYQLIVNLLQPAGIGKLQQQYEQLKTKLHAEGLFDAAHKKAIPRYPERIGVVTSETGAAFQDIRSTLENRWPLAEVLLHHSAVQGKGAAEQIATAIHYFSEQNNVDVLIIGRGGGSLEDLWPFNEEIVARAVFDCKVPIISGVGHEVDFAISDFVADMRAATPTQAAVLASPDINEVRMALEDMANKLQLNVVGVVEYLRERVQFIGKSHALLAVNQKFEQARMRNQNVRQQLGSAFQNKLQKLNKLYSDLHHRMALQNPNEPLEKGFTRIWQDGKWIRTATAFTEGQSLEIEWKEGRKKLN